MKATIRTEQGLFRNEARAAALGITLAFDNGFFEAWYGGEVVTAPMTEQETFWYLQGFIQGKVGDTRVVAKTEELLTAYTHPLTFYYGLKLWHDYLDAKAQWEYAHIAYEAAPTPPASDMAREAVRVTRERMDTLLDRLRATPEHREAFGW